MKFKCKKSTFLPIFGSKMPLSQKFGVCLRLATFLLFVINQLFIFLPKFGSKTIAITCEWSFSGKNPLFLPIFGSKKPLSQKFGVCLRLATFLLFVIYQLFIFLPKFWSKTIAISCQLKCSGRNPLFCLILGF